MRVKLKPERTKQEGNCIVALRTVYRLLDCEGEVIRECESKFPNSVKTKVKVVLVNLDELGESPF